VAGRYSPPPVGAAIPGPGTADREITRERSGLRTKRASNAAVKSNAMATAKIGTQLPVDALRRLPIGTSKDAVPLAVYNAP
jgi:hypothetical protein